MIAGLDRGRATSPRKAGRRRRRRRLPGHRRRVAAQHRDAGPTPPPATSRDGKYYVRINGSGTPNDGAIATGPTVPACIPRSAIIDAGFLELTRLGVKAPGRPLRRALPAGRRPVAQGDRPPAATCASATPSTATARPPTGHRGPESGDRPRRGRCCPANAASTCSATAATPCPTCRPWPTPPTPVHDPRTGLGPGRPDGLQPRLRQGNRVRGTAGLGDGPVRPPRAGHRRRQGRRDPERRRRPVCASGTAGRAATCR